MGDTLFNLAHQTGFFNLTVGNVIMIAVALGLLYLAIVKEYEPLLLLPISFGMLLVNLYPPIMEEGGLLHYFFMLDEWTILPSLIFLGVGALTDFGPLIARASCSELRRSSEYSELSCWRCSWDSLKPRQRQSASSEERTDLHPSSWQ